MTETRTSSRSGARARSVAAEAAEGPHKTSQAPRRTPPLEQEAKAAPKEHLCNVAFCPIGLALSAAQGAAPDVLEHLLKAAQEFFLAARAVMDTRSKDFEDEPDRSHLERIEIS